MRYSNHARIQMVKRGFSEAEIEQIIANPQRGKFEPSARDIIEHFGDAADGRQLNVVTNHAKTLVVTVIEQ